MEWSEVSILRYTPSLFTAHVYYDSALICPWGTISRNHATKRLGEYLAAWLTTERDDQEIEAVLTSSMMRRSTLPIGSVPLSPFRVTNATLPHPHGPAD